MDPDLGDIAWVEFGPVLGTEQAGRRPALVLSNKNYHEQSWRAVVCPITRKQRVWPFNVALPPGLATTGMVLVDQVRSIDRSKRMFGIIEWAPADLVAEVQGRLFALLRLDGVALRPL